MYFSCIAFQDTVRLRSTIPQYSFYQFILYSINIVQTFSFFLVFFARVVTECIKLDFGCLFSVRKVPLFSQVRKVFTHSVRDVVRKESTLRTREKIRVLYVHAEQASNVEFHPLSYKK